MSVINRREVKVQLPRSGPDVVWDVLLSEFPQGCRRRLRYLAILALHEVGGWSMEDIGQLFKHNKGHVSRCLDRVKQLIREEFELEPERKQLGDVHRRHLAMLDLREQGWTLVEIGQLFKHNKGHVSRCLVRARELRAARPKPPEKPGARALTLRASIEQALAELVDLAAPPVGAPPAPTPRRALAAEASTGHD